MGTIGLTLVEALIAWGAGRSTICPSRPGAEAAGIGVPDAG